MKTCPECELFMITDTSSDSVRFICSLCGYVIEGEPEDARLAGSTLHASDTEEMYRRLIRNAAFDRVNQQIKEDCPVCGLDYLTQIRVSSREIVIKVCKCGYNSSEK